MEKQTLIRLHWRHVTPKAKRPRCRVVYEDGHRCNAPVVWDRELNRPLNDVCYRHGGYHALKRAKAARGRPHTDCRGNVS